MSESDLAKEIYENAIRFGFDDCGIIPLDSRPMAGFSELLTKREQDVPESKFFYDNVGNLGGVGERFPWSKAVVMLCHNYGKYRYPKDLQGKYAKAYFLYPGKGNKDGFDLEALEGWFAEKGIRAEGGEHFHFLGIGSLRYLAMKAGLGNFRRNNFFYTKNGSWNTLVGYVIDQECELIRDVAIAPCPPKCDLCLKACKTKALSAPYTMNPLKCVSWLTTFGNCGVPEGFNADMFQEWVMGCDNCQDACPFNRKHDWNVGGKFSDIEEIAPKIMPENYDNLPDEFLIKEIIDKSDEHMQPSQVDALRKNAKRALEYRMGNGQKA